MGKDPAMPFYVNDYLSSPRVAQMDAVQERGYFRLLLFCWASGDASLPKDDKSLAELSRMGEGWFTDASKVVRDCFSKHPQKRGYLTHSKIFELWKERQDWREKSKLGGIKSGQSRRKQSKGGSTKGEPTDKPKGNSSSSSSSSIPPPPTPPAPGDEFPSDGTWDEVEVFLLNFEGGGVATAATVLGTAREHGATVSDVARLFAHWASQRPAWDLGALAQRITLLHPGQDVAKLWPAPSKAKRLDDRDRYYEAQRRKREAEEAERQQKEREHQQRFAELEGRFGARLDAMSRKEIRAFTTNACGNSASFYLKAWGNTGSPRGDHRYALLEALEQEAAESARAEPTILPLPKFEVVQTGRPLGLKPAAVGGGREF